MLLNIIIGVGFVVSLSCSVLYLVLTWKAQKQPAPVLDETTKALALWREHGENVWTQVPSPTPEMVRVWEAMERTLDRSAQQRVCNWCGATNVPRQVHGLLTQSATSADVYRWYCSNRCYREGHGYDG